MSGASHPDFEVGVAFFIRRNIVELLMIDNYDSFTYNLVQLFYEFDIRVSVFRHDKITPDGIEEMKPDWICISPGPKDPAHAGVSKAVVERFGPRIPILGVCLGMQVINEVFGGRTLKAPTPVHGKRSRVHHLGRGIFKGIPSPFHVARYHSLCIDIRSPMLLPVAHAEDGVVMGVEHRSWPLFGAQFHPESFMSQYGLRLAANFLEAGADWKAESSYGFDSEACFPRYAQGKGV
jgi:anthranilate synthase component 2